MPKFAAPRGVPPSIEQMRVHELRIDPSYQRSTVAQDGTAMIRHIAEHWDWRLCAPLTVSRRFLEDGRTARYFVIDGQHRLEAARVRGDIPYLPCIISTFETVAEEAACFVAVNTRRRAVTVLDKFRASLAAGDKHAIAVNALIAEAGLSLAPHNNHTCWKLRQISCVGSIGGALKRHGEAVVKAALADVAAAFADEVLRYSGRILQGLYLLHASPPPRFDAGTWRHVLKARNQQGWNASMLSRQARHGELPDSAMHYAMVDAWTSAMGKAG